MAGSLQLDISLLLDFQLFEAAASVKPFGHPGRPTATTAPRFAVVIGVPILCRPRLRGRLRQISDELGHREPILFGSCADFLPCLAQFLPAPRRKLSVDFGDELTQFIRIILGKIKYRLSFSALQFYKRTVLIGLNAILPDFSPIIQRDFESPTIDDKAHLLPDSLTLIGRVNQSPDDGSCQPSLRTLSAEQLRRDTS